MHFGRRQCCWTRSFDPARHRAEVRAPHSGSPGSLSLRGTAGANAGLRLLAEEVQAHLPLVRDTAPIGTEAARTVPRAVAGCNLAPDSAAPRGGEARTPLCSG
eukprot:2660488-Alexandrium_andersonii.AAC.1